jgi:hypothetical protein
MVLRSHDGETEDLRYDQLLLAVGSVSRSLPIPGPRRACDRLQEPRRCDLASKPRDRDARARNATEDPERLEALLTYVFVGGGYSGLEALAELQDFAADAIGRYPRAPARDALDPGRGDGPGAARGASRPRRVRPARVARARDRGPPQDAARRGWRRHGAALDRGADPDADDRLDRRGRTASEPQIAGGAARRARQGGGRRVHAGRWAARGMGDRRLCRRPRPEQGRARPLPADRAARGAPGPGGRPQHRRRAGRRTRPRRFGYRARGRS